MSENKVELYRVLRRWERTSIPRIGEPTITVSVMYVAPGMPPYTVWIPKEEHSPEKEREVVLADIEDKKRKRPEVVTL